MTNWREYFQLFSIKYKCGFCNREVASVNGWTSDGNSSRNTMNIRICPNCDRPTFFDFEENQVPSEIFGNNVEHLPENIENLYNEARACIKVNAYTSAVMACRKLLMNIAVSKEAEEGLSFKEYVEYLETKGFTPPGSKEWIDHIRTQGNEANHEIALKKRDDAIDLIIFSEMLLKFIYEFSGKIKTKNVVKK